MTSVAKHMARRKPGESPATAPERHRRNSQLREQFPPRPAQPWWPETAQDQEAVLRRLTSPPFTAEGESAQAARRRGTVKILRWLASFPGDTWQQRWEASGVEAGLGSTWTELPLAWFRERGESSYCDAGDLSSGLLMLSCADVVRPGLSWMLTRVNHHLAPVMAETRDPAGFARLRGLAGAGPDTAARKDARLAATRIATILACKGGVISDITVGDCVELADTQRQVQARGGQKKVDFYLRLHALGVFPADAPATIRAFGMARGQLTIEEIVDRYQLQCKPVRDLLVDYLRERQPALDYGSMQVIGSSLAGLFWARIEALAPGIGMLRLPPEVARAWKEDLQTVKRTVTGPDGQKTVITKPRLSVKNELIRVRAFYLDIAQWATEEPERWAQWAVPSPVSDAEVNWAKERRHRKARMDQRTRERLPVLPVLTRTAAERRNATARTAPGRHRDTSRRDHRGHRRDAPPGRGPQGQRKTRLGRGHRHRQAAQPDLRGRGSVLGVRRDRGPETHRHPLRGAPGAHPSQHHRVPAALDRRARPATAGRPKQDRYGEAAPGVPRAGRRLVRDHQPGPRPRRRRPAHRFVRRPGTGLEPAHAAAVPAEHRQRDPGAHPERDPQPAHQCARRDRPDRRLRRPARFLSA
jgi:hypothetical protein